MTFKDSRGLVLNQEQILAVDECMDNYGPGVISYGDGFFVICFFDKTGAYEVGLEAAKHLREKLGVPCFPVSVNDMAKYHLSVYPFVNDSGWRGRFYDDNGKEIEL